MVSGDHGSDRVYGGGGDDRGSYSGKVGWL